MAEGPQRRSVQLETQRVNIFKLAEANVAAKKEVAERLEKLVKAGTDPVKDLVAAKADLLQAQIQGEKDKHEAQTNVDNAKRTLGHTRTAVVSGRHRSGAAACKTSASKAIVVAEVPEARVGLARQGDPCTAEFYAFPDIKFDGIVGSVSPTISKERRTLRVFFQVSDPKGLLKPGMYADVGLCDLARGDVAHSGRTACCTSASSTTCSWPTAKTNGSHAGQNGRAGRQHPGNSQRPAIRATA